MCGSIRNVAVLTGGGDCPGLNAVIRGVTKTLLNNHVNVFGVLDGFNGLVNDKILPLDFAQVTGILPRGGTVLGTTNRDNPFHIAISTNGKTEFYDKSQQAVDVLKSHKIDALIVVGGDGSLAISARLVREYGVNIVGCPKTIDNDITGTERTFGFDTALAMATEAIDRLHTTAESHHRVMVLEVMGRYAGWIALHSGIAGGADVILIPEIPYQITSVVRKIEDRCKNGKKFSIVVVAEGAKPTGGEISVRQVVNDSFEKIRLGGVGNKVARDIEALTGIETRCTVLGYLQRGGSPTPFDRVLATRFGVAAAESCLNSEFNVLMSLQEDKILPVDLQIAGTGYRSVSVDSDLVRTAKQIGIVFGDNPA